MEGITIQRSLQGISPNKKTKAKGIARVRVEEKDNL
jgi:hypothetical protein